MKKWEKKKNGDCFDNCQIAGGKKEKKKN